MGKLELALIPLPWRGGGEADGVVLWGGAVTTPPPAAAPLQGRGTKGSANRYWIVTFGFYIRAKHAKEVYEHRVFVLPVVLIICLHNISLTQGN